MKRELKVGERVRVYAETGLFDGVVEHVFTDRAPSIRVRHDDGIRQMTRDVFRQQCRRLRRRERSEKRERVVRYGARAVPEGTISCLVESSPSAALVGRSRRWEAVRLVECAENEVVLSRAELAKAWDSLREKFSHAVNSSHTSNQFYFLAKALGLGAE